MPCAPTLAKAFPEIQRATRFWDFKDGWVKSGDKAVAIKSIKAVDPELFKIFTLPAVQGNPETALLGSSSVILSQRTAEALFGRADILGRPVRITRTFLGQVEDSVYVVGAVIKNQPSNSTYEFEALVPIETLPPHMHEDWRWSTFPTFLLCSPRDVHSRLGRKIRDFNVRSQAIPAEWALKNERADLLRLADIHSSDPRLAQYLSIFGAIALTVLLLACINYVNLTTARGLLRAKEIGVRKTSGASISQLVRQFIGESFLTTLAALAAALALVPALFPVFKALSGRDIVLSEMSFGPLAGGLTGLVLFVALISGLYPAFALAAIKPVSLFQANRSTRGARSKLRKTMVFAQFAASSILLVLALVISRQFQFIKNADLGMKVDNLVVLNTDNQTIIRKTSLDSLKGEFLGRPGVLRAAASWSIPPDIAGSVLIKPEGKDDSAKTPWTHLAADPDFLAAYRIRLVEGRLFSRTLDEPDSVGRQKIRMFRRPDASPSAFQSSFPSGLVGAEPISGGNRARENSGPRPKIPFKK